MNNNQEYYPKPVSLESTKKICYQMIECVCKVYNPSGEFGTGFFMKIPCQNKTIPTLITSYHVLNEGYLNTENEILIILENDEKSIKLNNNKIIYTNEKLDITIIEILEKDFIKNIHFLELDEEITYRDYGTENIYMLQYNERLGVSYGIIKKSEDMKIIHTCYSEMGSAGSPILNSRTQRVIGIHIGRTKLYNHGILINYAIEDFIKFYITNDIHFKEYKESDFTNLKLLSAGSFCDVYSEQDNNEICLKKINIEKMNLIYQLNNLKDYQKDINNEIYILKLLSSNKNSVKYYGKYEKEKEKVIVMELCDQNLKEFMKKKNKALTDEEIKTKFLELNKLFKEMQKEKIIHIDLNLENFLVKYNKEKTDYTIKLCDYGAGKLKKNLNTIFSGVKGTIETIEPEIILGKEPKYENENVVDIFSLGIILYQLSHNLKHPFGENPVNYILIYE